MSNKEETCARQTDDGRTGVRSNKRPTVKERNDEEEVIDEGPYGLNITVMTHAALRLHSPNKKRE